MFDFVGIDRVIGPVFDDFYIDDLAEVVQLHIAFPTRPDLALQPRQTVRTALGSCRPEDDHVARLHFLAQFGYRPFADFIILKGLLEVPDGGVGLKGKIAGARKQVFNEACPSAAWKSASMIRWSCSCGYLVR